MAKIANSQLPTLANNRITYGYLTIIEEESRFVFQQSQSELSTIRFMLAAFCIAAAIVFSVLATALLPVWLCVVIVVSIALYVIRVIPKIYSQPFHYFTVEKQDKQIRITPKTENAPVQLKREETYAFYVWLNKGGDDHEEAIFHIDRQDQKTTLLEQIGYGDNAKQIALFLGNLWDKPVMLRDTEGRISELSRKRL